MNRSAFVYGTLMADEVLQRLLRRVPPTRPATLSGYSRYRVRGAVYPAILPEPGAKVKGKVLIDLSPREVEILDMYETFQYYRQTVEPVLEDGSTMTADVYVWKDEFKNDLEFEPWDYDLWRKNNLRRWVSRSAPDAAHPGGDMMDEDE